MAASRAPISVIGEHAGEIAEDVETSSPSRDLFDHFDDVGFLGNVTVYECRCDFAVLLLDLLFDAAGV